MKKYTEKEIDAIMSRINFPDGLSTGGMLKILYWLMFNRKKMNQFCWNIERGMSVYSAFEDASKTIKEKQKV